jgi:hypothetical protein
MRSESCQLLQVFCTGCITAAFTAIPLLQLVYAYTVRCVLINVLCRCEQLRPEACSWIAAACSQLTAVNVTDCTHVSSASVKQLTNGVAAANGFLQAVKLGNCKNLNKDCLNSLVQLGG